MTKVISCILVLSLILVMTISAMPSTQRNSVIMSDAQMMVSVGGDGSCAWTMAAVGFGFIATGLSGPIGWGATVAIICSGGSWIAAAC